MSGEDCDLENACGHWADDLLQLLTFLLQLNSIIIVPTVYWIGEFM